MKKLISINKIYLLLFLLLTSCNAKVEEPEFRRIGNFDVKQLGFQQSTIGFNVVYYNPNNFGLTVKEAACDIYLDSVYIGKFVQPAPVDVNKNAEFNLPLNGSVGLQTVLQLNFKDLVQKEVLVRANGTVKVGKAGIFFTRPFSYQGKHRLELSL
ncbi:MAG: LEA type 2 family protein [Nostoc sp. C3-bin3]|nr:LEA type 2 family protein [Nostoc sp. C3-bin3]